MKSDMTDMPDRLKRISGGFYWIMNVIVIITVLVIAALIMGASLDMTLA